MSPAVSMEKVVLERGFEAFLESLRDTAAGATVLSPKRFGDALHIDMQALAVQARVHRNTISRAPEAESVQRFLREAVRVLRAATDLSGDLGRALFWYRNEPLAVFNYKTPEQLVADGRADDLIQYVESLQAGAAG